MIKAGCLNDVDNIFGIHVMSTFPTGSVQFHSGATQTGRANFDLVFRGTGAHASMPQLGNDAIVAGSYFVNAVQTVVSRRIDPFHESSVTISSFDGKSDAYNAIQGEVRMKGDVRMMSENDRKIIRQNIERMVKGTATTFNLKADLDYNDNYPVLVNNLNLTRKAEEWIKESNLSEVKLIKDRGQNTPSEDFAYYAQKLPACFYYVGCQSKDGSINPHHNLHFLLNEDSLIICAKSAAAVIAHYFA